MDTPHGFSNYLKTTLNHGLNLSEVDGGDLKRESRIHEPSLKEVDWGGKIKPNHTSSGCLHMEVDWGGKLRVNHLNECMLSEVDRGAHETHQNEHSITEVDWGGHDPRLYPMDGCMLSEVDWGTHDSNFFLYLVHIDHDAKPKDFFTQQLWGGLQQRMSSTPLMEYLKDSFDTGQIEDGFSNSKSIKGYRSSYTLPDPEHHESSYSLRSLEIATLFLTLVDW